MPALPARRLEILGWILWAILIALLLASLRFHWPDRVLSVCVALLYTLVMPGMVVTLTFGAARRWFARLRYKPGWIIAYLLLALALNSPRLGWSALIWLPALAAGLLLAGGLTVAQLWNPRTQIPPA